MATKVQNVVVNYRRYVDVADLELFLRDVERVNPHMTVHDYVKHVIKQVCERE